MKRGTGAIRMGAAFTLLFASLTLVVFRQSRALDALGRLERARQESVLLQAERAQLAREIQHLEGRARIVAVAGERFGLRVPAADEIVILGAPQLAQVKPATTVQRGMLSAAEVR